MATDKATITVAIRYGVSYRLLNGTFRFYLDPFLSLMRTLCSFQLRKAHRLQMVTYRANITIVVKHEVASTLSMSMTGDLVQF